MSALDRSESAMYDGMMRLRSRGASEVAAKMSMPTYKELIDMLDRRREEMERMQLSAWSPPREAAPRYPPITVSAGSIPIIVAPLVPADQVWMVAQGEHDDDPAIVRILKFGSEDAHVDSE